MNLSTSVLTQLLESLPQLHAQLYFKSSLTALSHAMEDQVLASGAGKLLVIASFQRERFYRQEAHRYVRIAELTPQVYVLAAPETSFGSRSDGYETIAFEPTDQLSQEWHLVVIGEQFASCLICRERQISPSEAADAPAMDQSRRFEGIWTFDRQVCKEAAKILLDRIQLYRPELTQKTILAQTELLASDPADLRDADPDPFAQRLVTYLQAGQYKLLKAYRSISAQNQRERLVNFITAAIRRSLNPEEIFRVAVSELGQAMEACRCLIYRCKASDISITIDHEFLVEPNLPSLAGQSWELHRNPLFQTVVERHEAIALTNTQREPLYDLTALQPMVQQWQIRSWLMVPVLYQERLLGMVELHTCNRSHHWTHDELAMVEAIAAQLGVALIQAESYANLEDLNQQLEALERARSNLIAITGHELRTPLSTIQVCLESLASEPEMPLELRQVMLDTAMTDAERMRNLIQDFLTLSRLESGRVEWHLEPLALNECVDLALSSIRTRQIAQLPSIDAQVPGELPLVRADGEWLVEVLSKLLDNACKFTEPQGQVIIKVNPNGGNMLEVTVADTGRGIEPNRLETVFDRFYQEEGALRRTAGGTGLGLAICRQVVRGLGGTIWAESAGRDQGSQFHFTIPIAQDGNSNGAITNGRAPQPVSRRRRDRSSTPAKG